MAAFFVVLVASKFTGSSPIARAPRPPHYRAFMPSINYVPGNHGDGLFVSRASCLVAEAAGLSQLQLAMAAGCSQRHISFLELGRTKPSREMVLRLSTTLDLPLRQSNELLLAAGYAPVWAESDLSAQALAPIREALNYILAQQEPFPAVVIDRRWNLRQANKGAVAMVEFLVGPLQPGAAINLADALVAPDVLRPHLMNWSDVVHYFVRSVEADAAADGTPETAALSSVS